MLRHVQKRHGDGEVEVRVDQEAKLSTGVKRRKRKVCKILNMITVVPIIVITGKMMPRYAD
jgi:hypothetical protein